MRNEGTVSLERVALAALIALLGATCIAVALTAFRLPLIAACAVALALAAAVCRPIARALPTEWDGFRHSHGLLCALWLALALCAVTRTAGVALFMADAEQPQASAFWFDDFYIRHNCFSAWWKAAELAKDGATNVYDSELYAGNEGRFKLDDFLYLPQFLILPRAGIATGADFLQLRAGWFALEAGSLAAIMFALCAWIGGATGRRAALAMPAVWLATPTLLTLQIGNFQIAAIAMTVFAMLAFERGRNALGGALFGFALFKIFPGLLGVYLVVTRQWRAVFWTAGFCAIYTAIAYVAIGPAPFDAFLHYEAPRIANGEAWAWLENEGLGAVVAINDSVPGLVLKLNQLGVPGMTRAVEGIVSWLWALLAIALAVVAGVRSAAMTRLEKASAWLALLSVAAFRSPFVPDTYGLFPLLWLWTLLWAAREPSRKRVTTFTLLWLAFAVSLPFSGMPLPDLTARLVVSTVSQIVAIFVALAVLVRRPTSPVAIPATASSDVPVGTLAPVQA